MTVLDEKMREVMPKLVTFDPYVKDHMRAYYSIKYQGKQSKDYRFHLEKPFTSVPAMMEHKLAQMVLKQELSPMLDYTYAATYGV